MTLTLYYSPLSCATVPYIALTEAGQAEEARDAARMVAALRPRLPMRPASRGLLAARGLTTDSDPSARDVAALIRLVREHGLECFFPIARFADNRDIAFNFQ